ncbi:MAG: tetratricopeptide repeat protein [Candidatus Promineifilaceae bacterium]
MIGLRGKLLAENSPPPTTPEEDRFVEGGGDEISIGDIDNSSAIAVGRGAKASIFNIDIRLLPLVIGLGLLTTLLTYFQFFRQEDRPQTMDPGFNVAIAEFLVEDRDGNLVSSEEGLKFGRWLYERVEGGLESELEEFSDTHPLHVWSPENTGVISGNTPAERAAAAEARAKEVGADIIIYGTLVQGEDESKTSIEFYVNHDSFAEGQDIKGHHEFGGSLSIDNPFKEGLAELGNTPLSERAKSLSLVAVGLAYYSIDDFDNAIHYLQEADGDEDWYEKEEGKHVVKLLLGNAYLRKGSIEKNPELVPIAQAYYQEALDIDDEYARATMGIANTALMMALGDPNDDRTQIDSELLNRAQEGYEKALTLKEDEDLIDIQSKADYGLGNVYMLRYQLEGGAWLDKAVERFEAIISAYESGNSGIKDLAAHAYARRGFIQDVYRNQTEAASEDYKVAAEIASPFYKGIYASMLGDVYAKLCQLDLARESYDDAVKIAKLNSDREQVALYREKQDELDDLVDCS